MSDDEKVHTLISLDRDKTDEELTDDVLDAFEGMGVEVDREGEEGESGDQE